jgi:hypothetical protein
MSDTHWGDVLVFFALQGAAAFAWFRLRRSQPAVDQPQARVIPFAPYLPPVEPDARQQVAAHR